MKYPKVMTVVGTRPEIIRLSRIISCLNNNVNHVLVHTGQNYDYELNEIFFKELEIQRPNYFLNAAGQTAAETIGKIIIAIDPLFEKEKPDALLILGDTNSCLVSIPAKRRKIPIFHMEAGNRCFDFRVPEEINRRLVDHISDINMPYSDIAREYLLRENIHPDTIIKTGSPMMEVLKYYKSVIDSSNILRKLNLKEKEYFVASFHREENVDSDNILKIFDVLNDIATLYQKPIVVSTHPRTAKKIKEGQIKIDERVMLCKPFGFPDYVFLQKNSMAVLSDSGTITEESSILNFPSLNIRSSHERPEGMEEAVTIMTGINKKIILSSLDIILCRQKCDSNIVKDYNYNNVSEKVLGIILSYIDYVNKKVWFKEGEDA